VIEAQTFLIYAMATDAYHVAPISSFKD
jgi:hypothetical protein